LGTRVRISSLAFHMEGRGMTSKSQKHSIVGFLQLSGKKSARGVLFGLALLGVFVVTPAQAAVFTVNSPSDVVDANRGNGVCETAAGNGVCTLRAAIQEANALAGADQIILPPNTYLLAIVSELGISDSVTITGVEHRPRSSTATRMSAPTVESWLLVRESR
jgi:CSLREA domain-containing protein